MSKIELCLWYDDCAEEAADFYVSTFRECGQDAAINGITHYTEVGPRPSGTVLTVEFTLAGQGFIALNGGPHFTLTPPSRSRSRARTRPKWTASGRSFRPAARRSSAAG